MKQSIHVMNNNIIFTTHSEACKFLVPDGQMYRKGCIEGCIAGCIAEASDSGDDIYKTGMPTSVFS